MDLIETVTAIPSQLKEIPDRGPGMYFRFIDAPEEQKGIYQLGEKKGTPMVNLWNVKGANILESAAMTEHVMVVRERSGSITRLRDFPDLKKGDKFRITEGEQRGRLFTLQTFYNSGPYWVIAFDEVGPNESAWNIISTWVEVEPVYPAPAPDRPGIDPVALQGTLDNMASQMRQRLNEQAEGINRLQKFSDYVAQQLNILIDIATLAVNTDNIETVKSLLRPLIMHRDYYLQENSFNAAKPQTGFNPVKDEENRAAGIRAAGANLAGFESSTPYSQ